MDLMGSIDIISSSRRPRRRDYFSYHQFFHRFSIIKHCFIIPALQLHQFHQSYIKAIKNGLSAT